ncbi:hypothetical protein [Phenylobacterium sp.]|uniref:hypothetical protein n=1 Tax=Phenylobacterium sp. TaxID=1871053 RepID=UPI002BF3FEF9|nr:hypothetical protein [Phenylobacterium sp.]HLZ76753.1 hypothetical protein [Phenylobacterium sp.]
MSLAPESAPESAPKAEALADPKALLRVPVGLASPLWPLFTGVAVSGAAWWWMTRWTQPANLEAMFGAMKTAEAETQAEVLALAEPVVEVAEAAAREIAETVTEAEAAAEPVLESVAEALVEPVIEASPEPVLEALVDAPAAVEPVGGESAPVSPVLEAIAPKTVAPETVEPAAEPVDAPKPKKKVAAPKAD